MSGLLTAWAELLMGALAQAGITNVVVSPGSRSTPFVWAALHNSKLKVHNVIDERSAAFFALGQARVTGRPSLLLCTSGTAGAHYYPAVIEASLAGVPLLILTADRPFELQSCAAPQTVDQTRLFGSHARAFFELGAPDLEAAPGLVRMAHQAVHLATFPVAGAVHLNARARKPLEPQATEGLGALLNGQKRRAARPRILPADHQIEALRAALTQSTRPLLVAGPAPASQRTEAGAILAFAEAAGLVVFSEATSQLGATPFEAALAAGAARFSPDLVLELGLPPTSGHYARWLDPAVPRYVVHPSLWPDPQNNAQVVVGDILPTLAALGDFDSASRRPWKALWEQIFAKTRTEVQASLNSPELSEGHVVADTFAAAPARSWMMLGNSLVVRHADTYCDRDDLGVLHQRGASGIDGLISGAAGAASHGPTTLLLGDVSALHDLGGLALARHAEHLVIVVLNNDGGRIFEQLPLAKDHAQDPGFASFTTPHGLRFAGAAQMFGLGYHAVDTRAGLVAALAKAHRGGATLIEAVVPPSGAAQEKRRLTHRLQAALEGIV